MRLSCCLSLALALAGAAILNAQPEAPDAPKLFTQAQELLKDGKLEEALDVAKKALALDPRNDRCLAAAANLTRLAGKYAESIELARKAIQINDQVALYHGIVAFAAIKNQDLELCREACKKALSLPPQSFDQESYLELVKLNDLVRVRKLHFTWPLNPKKGIPHAGAYPVAVPPEKLKGQSSEYELSGDRSHQTLKQGDNTILLVVPKGKENIDLVLNVTLDPYSYKKDLEKYQKKPIPREIQPFLGASEAINPKSPALSKIAREVKDENAITTVKNILAWQKQHLKYKVDEKATFKSDFDSVDQLVKRGEGECRGWSMLFTGLCRAAGVPARHFWGLVLIVPDEKTPKWSIRSHVWAEVYLTGVGWVPVDPQDPSLFGFLPNTYVRIYTDMRKSRSSTENLPILNLLAMGNEGFHWEQVK